MRDDQISRVKSRSAAIEKSFDTFLRFLGETTDKDGRAFDISRPIPQTDSSLSDLRARAAAVAGLVTKFDEKGGALTPLADFAAMVNAGNAITNAITQTTDSIENHLKSSGGLHSIDYDSLVFTTENGQTVSFQGNFKTLFDSTESYIKSFQDVFQTVNPSRASFNFSSATESLSKIISRATEARENLQAALNTTRKQLDEVTAKQVVFDSILDDVRVKQARLDEQSATANEAIASISAKNDEASSLEAVTATLRERVGAYESEFKAFQDQLGAMKQNYETSDKNLTLLIERFNTQATSFDEMIEKSNQMLSSSTVSGLASEFGTIRNDLDNKLTDAHTSFNRAIIFLFLSALPLILFVFAPFLVAIFPDNSNIVAAISGMTGERSGWQYIGQVVARFVVLLPAIWYVTFCTARYNSLFKLKEHYSYKYSMAVAVDGFKKQAPDYQDMIAALVFEQLAFNPVDKLGKRHDGPESPPNPIASMLVKMLRRDARAATE
ncbi:coiled-coil domain-containing protein [Pelagerythrobacter rhizovicinus]|uniref:Uncharacterized protein n=1 Tax=Pelagerythrobacter rhizovicinus TaxID=2268576 RepID=A0A4Q2KMA7_9SPHN|nr:hypothetical protein [Pelagerythrobacter rhizovicinus]RXZ66464.1 hypothetical protein ETX26_07220 [Pelagerythrobacter rhizovicinus]